MLLFLVLAVFMTIGTVLFVAWNIFMLRAENEHLKAAAGFAYRAKAEKVAALTEQREQYASDLEKLAGQRLLTFFQKMFYNPKSVDRKIKTLQKEMAKLDRGNFSGVNFLVLPGYAILQMEILNITGDQKYFQDIRALYSELKGAEFAIYNTRHLLAAMISCVLGFSGASILAGGLAYAVGVEQGLALIFGGLPLALLLAYALYEDLRAKGRVRKEEIMLDFPQAVTEVALLTSSGMELFRAWDEVCKSAERKGPLFREMRRTISEINNGFSPSAALNGFIKRCGTKDTARLGTSILQNLTRGNDELSEFLANLSKEVWEERKHDARRLGEQAKSKLLLPMGLIFLGIILIIMVPIAIGITEMGF
ncbi:MAG: type II secretion system F family protein [Defluviitaleaceae bacterium]|nr:type II secretion system F family protein [Defluviitaleaceae bacterium]